MGKLIQFKMQNEYFRIRKCKIIQKVKTPSLAVLLHSEVVENKKIYLTYPQETEREDSEINKH